MCDEIPQCDLTMQTLKYKQETLYALVIYVAQSHKMELNVDWVIDSGCTQHACNNKDAFTDMTYKRVPILLADHSTIYTSGRGTVGKFTNVNYVPEFKHNLLSVNQLTQDGYTIIFTTDNDVIIHSQDGQQRLGTFQQGVYTTSNDSATYGMNAIVRDQTNRYVITPAQASDLIHQRWGHAFIQRIIDAQRRGLVTGFNTSVSAIHFCEACAKAKLHETPSSQTPNLQPGAPDVMRRLHKVSCDVSGKIHIRGIYNVNYFVLFIDQATRYMWIMFVKDLTTENMINAFEALHQKVLQAQEQLGEVHIMRTFKTDNAGAFKDEMFIKHVNEKNVRVEFASPHSHYQNGIAERAIRTIRGMGMCMMLHAKVPKHLWPYAFKHAVYINNRLPTTILGKHTTPFIEMFNYIPDERHLKVFGCDAYALLHNGHKHGPTAHKCIHIGREDESTGYLLYNPHTKKVSTSVHV